MEIPPTFDDEFLEWFRDRTNKAWSSWTTTPFSSYQAANIGGRDWQHGTRWRAGLSTEEIDRAEAEWSLRFPPDYRLFLSRLHTVDRPMTGAKFTQAGLVRTDEPSFYDWQRDHHSLRRMFVWPHQGLVFDVNHNDLWLDDWGPRPDSLFERKRRLTELVKRAPRLIPIYEHRYLLAEPCLVGNPVFSVWQDDIIVYGKDLRSYFLIEFADLLGLKRRDNSEDVDEETMAKVRNVPFWGALISHNEED